MTRVLLADDQSLVRAGFRMILKAEPGIEVVGEASDGIEAVAQARELAPDVVLMDIRMPLDGIEATRQVVTGETSPRVLVLTTFEVLRLVARGLTNAEIATALVVSEHTVKTHVARIFQKLALRDRTQAVVIAYETGLVTPGNPET